jgi:hypothetical protein
MLTSLILLAAPAHAGAMLGADLTPAGRGDLAWVLDGRSTSDLAAETDGLLTPPLTLWGGWLAGQNAMLGGLAVQRTTTWSWSGTDVATVAAGGVRPSFDYRRYLRPREPGRATPWLQAGAWVVIPNASYSNTAWTDEEQAAYEEQAAQDRAAIGGLGLRVGPGGEVLFDNGLSLGLRGGLGLYQATERTSAEVSRTWMLTTDAALTLALSF